MLAVSELFQASRTVEGAIRTDAAYSWERA